MANSTGARAERVKELLRSRRSGVLATSSQRVQGFPFASAVTYALDARGLPVFLFSRLALHTQNLLADAKASLLVFDPGADNPLTSPRVNVFGEIAPVPEQETEAVRDAYLARHPESAEWVGFGDFAFYRMAPAAAYYVGGFGEMGWTEV